MLPCVSAGRWPSRFQLAQAAPVIIHRYPDASLIEQTPGRLIFLAREIVAVEKVIRAGAKIEQCRERLQRVPWQSPACPQHVNRFERDEAQDAQGRFRPSAKE